VAGLGTDDGGPRMLTACPVGGAWKEKKPFV
jgi:hypothetical protein